MKHLIISILSLSAIALLACCGTPAVREQKVVNIGYGRQLQDEVTSSIYSIDANENRYESFTSIYDYLKTVPGVIVEGKDIYIRGISSINSSTNPLILVDGISVDDVSMLNPRDIDNISVLKDAGAGAIYGVRGACGVILITTKKGGKK